MRVAFFTAGTVGAGHLVRSLAVERGLRRRGFQGDYRAFGPQLSFEAARTTSYQAVPIVPAELATPGSAQRTPLYAALRGFAPDLLLVDLFWAPVRHLVPLLGCEAWLLVRCVPRDWFREHPVWGYRPEHYRRVLAIEPFDHPAVREQLPPIVVCNPDECRPPQELRERLGVPSGRKLVLLAHAGLPGELGQLEADAEGAHLASADLHQPGALFPLAEWLPGADAIYGGAGYNLYWESRWLGLSGRTFLKPFPRRIDDQAWRLGSCAGYPVRENGADVLARLILG